MEKTVTISGKEVKFRTSGAIPHIYRRRFGRDIFLDMNALAGKVKVAKDGKVSMDIDSLEAFENLAYTFAKHADPTIPEDIEEWLEQFETFDIYFVFPEIFELWAQENKSTSTIKKKSVRSTGK